jgi:hypothetical protein
MATTVSSTIDTMLNRSCQEIPSYLLRLEARLPWAQRALMLLLRLPGNITYTPQAYDPRAFNRAPALLQPDLPPQITRTF